LRTLLLDALKCVKLGYDEVKPRNVSLIKNIKLKTSPIKNFSIAKPCQLKISLDGTEKEVLEDSMYPGKNWIIQKFYKFDQETEVKLFQDNMLIASKRILPNLRFRRNIKFNGNGADYQLIYTVLPASDEPDTVTEAIQVFRNSPVNSKWPHISKINLLADIESIVADPYNVKQHDTPFCGPASIVFELVSRNPIKYVGLLQSLYENGQFKLNNGKVVEARDKLLQSNVPNGIEVANWMLLGTIRDAENWLFPVKSKGDDDNPKGIVGMTFPGEMKGWSKNLLGFNKVSWKHSYIIGEVKAIVKAQEAIEKGGVAFLLIDTALLDIHDPLISIPQHWVPYLGNLNINRRRWYKKYFGVVEFDVFSWGQKFHFNKYASELRNHLWGVVIGLP
jgi:hypothetical protein